MAKVTPIGQPQNDPERDAIRVFRDTLPDDYRVLHNFELRFQNQVFEIDAAIISPHAIYLVDVKGTQGTIYWGQGKWHPDGRAPFDSPVAKIRHHARALKSLIVGPTDAVGLRDIWVEAVVVLTAPSAHLVDPQGRDRPNVVALQGCASYFTNPDKLTCPHLPTVSTVPYLGRIMQALAGPEVKPMRGLPLFQSWQCIEKLTAIDTYRDYRARNAHVPAGKGVTVRLRVYNADPYLPAPEKAKECERIRNSFDALSKIPDHPTLVPARDFFPTQDGDGFVLVTDDVPGSSLRQRLCDPRVPFTLEQKLKILRSLLEGLAHFHAHGIIHRALSPATVLIGSDGQPRITDFDYAKPLGGTRDFTVVADVPKQTGSSYQAPEVAPDIGDPGQASPASDVYAIGVTIYELLRGELPWANVQAAVDQTCVFAESLEKAIAGLPAGFDDWAKKLCVFQAKDRPPAAQALASLIKLVEPTQKPVPAIPEKPTLDYSNLQVGQTIERNYSVECRLGDGSFGVAYKVIDTLGDVPRTLKIITQDRQSVVSRMKQEYRTLLRVPDHPAIVKIIVAGIIEPEQYPYLVFDFVEGSDVKKLIEEKKLSVPEAVELGIQVAEGLDHLHTNKITHGDIKPANLLWLGDKAKILDFNVSILAGDPYARDGRTKKYFPPDLGDAPRFTDEERQDRDVYALGVTIYESVTGRYPWPEEKEPPIGKVARDPRELTGFEDLANGLVDVLLKAIAPRRQDRFASAKALLSALKSVSLFRAPKPAKPVPSTAEPASVLAVAKANYNGFVDYLLTLHSQSKKTNAGTRGLDKLGREIYVETELDRTLAPAVLAGQFRLVIITGNAGDGKTAFIQTVEHSARAGGASFKPSSTGNGGVFSHQGRTFLTNYDGSQDEGDKVNDQVLEDFLAPFKGTAPTAWPASEVRLIAINEGRLVDFLQHKAAQFPYLKRVVADGVKSGKPRDGVAVVNLNLRSVVAEQKEQTSIMERLLRRMVEPRFWEPCNQCDLRDKCYVLHNVRTFQDPAAGAQVLHRLRVLYELTTLRARLHITLRDLRSALAFMLVGTRSCDEIHADYAGGNPEEITKRFYFNSWMGGGSTRDRLLRLLAEIDTGQRGEPKLDRQFDFRAPDPAPQLMPFELRGSYDRALLSARFQSLPEGFNADEVLTRRQDHRKYVEDIRRLFFFEGRDDSWRRFLPYRSAERMLAFLEDKVPIAEATPEVVKAVNRGEGILDPKRLHGKLALQIRKVDGGTVRSYRVFPAARFKVVKHMLAEGSPYLEHAPYALALQYKDETGLTAELIMNLDVFEMLHRLNDGYRPSVDEIQGLYLSLNVFKNVLGSAPYQELLLTSSGHDFYSVVRAEGGRLEMAVSEDP